MVYLLAGMAILTGLTHKFIENELPERQFFNFLYVQLTYVAWFGQCFRVVPLVGIPKELKDFLVYMNVGLCALNLHNYVAMNLKQGFQQPSKVEFLQIPTHFAISLFEMLALLARYYLSGEDEEGKVKILMYMWEHVYVFLQLMLSTVLFGIFGKLDVMLAAREEEKEETKEETKND
ncbi:MAG: hypothetical protein ACTSUE_07725 [Promethearchaeota archaeon]